MVLDLRPLFSGETDRMAICEELDLSSFTFHGVSPLQKPVRFTGEIINRSGVLFLEAEAAYTYEAPCDRCLTPVSRQAVSPVRHTVVLSRQNGEDGELIIAERQRLCVEPLVEADIFLDMPQKFLCRPDCRGLCPHCGKNLNAGPCGCEKETGDPRLAVLSALLR